MLTCNLSIDISVPPVMDRIYGFRVPGCKHAVLSPRNLAVIYKAKHGTLSITFPEKDSLNLLC